MSLKCILVGFDGKLWGGRGAGIGHFDLFCMLWTVQYKIDLKFEEIFLKRYRLQESSPYGQIILFYYPIVWIRGGECNFVVHVVKNPSNKLISHKLKKKLITI